MLKHIIITIIIIEHVCARIRLTIKLTSPHITRPSNAPLKCVITRKVFFSARSCQPTACRCISRLIVRFLYFYHTHTHTLYAISCAFPINASHTLHICNVLNHGFTTECLRRFLYSRPMKCILIIGAPRSSATGCTVLSCTS